MINKVCRDTRREIEEAALHQALSESAAAHLQWCSGCRNFREERTRLRDLIGSLDPVNAPADFDFRLRARLAAQTQRSYRQFFSAFGFTVPATIAAAALVLFVASMVWINQKNGTQNVPVAGSQQPNNSSPSNATASGSGNPDTARFPNEVTNKPTGTESIAQSPGAATGRRLSGVASSRTRERSYDLSESAAQSIRGTDDAGAVSLAAPVKPIVVSMEDGRGATRTISLPPVSFGSQRLVDNRIPISANNRVW